MNKILIGLFAFGSISSFADTCRISARNFEELKNRIGFDNSRDMQIPSVTKSWMDLQYAMRDSNIEVTEDETLVNLEVREKIHGYPLNSYQYEVSIYPTNKEGVSYRSHSVVLPVRTREYYENFEVSSKAGKLITNELLSVFRDFSICQKRAVK